MYKLLEVNGVILPDPEGNYDISLGEKFNEYEGEDGSKTIEVIREGMINCNVSYKGLHAEKVKEIQDALKIVSTVVVFDPTSDSTKEITAKITDVKTQKKHHKNNISVWSLSFKIEEL